MINFKLFNNFYLSGKEKKLKALDKQIEHLKLSIKNEKASIENNEKTATELEKINSDIGKKYISTVEFFINTSKIFFIKNNNYKVSPWDKLNLVYLSKSYVLKTKKGEIIHVFKDYLNDFFKYINTFNYTIIVLSVDKNYIELEFRMKEAKVEDFL